MIDRSRGDAVRGRALAIVRAVVPDFVRRRFTLKFALILAVMGITVGVIGMTATSVVSSQVEQSVEQEYGDLAAQKANVVEEWIQRNSISVKLASKNEVLASSGGDTPYEIREELATTEGNLYGIQAIYLVNRTEAGTTIVASPQFPFGTDVTQTSRAWLENVSFGGLRVSDVRMTRVHDAGGTPVVAFISPVQDTENRYLVIEHNARQLGDSLQQGEQSARFTRVVDDDGTIQVATRHGEMLQQHGGEDAMRPVRLANDLEAMDRSAGVIARAGPHEGVSDEQYTVGYAPVRVENSDVEWTVLVHEPTSEVFGFVNAVSRWGKLSTLVGMVLIIALGAAIGYSTTHDINRLRALADRMREGDLDVTVESERIDSIGQLYDGFDAMRRSLKEQIEAAEQAREEAEVSRAEAMAMNTYLQNKAEEYSRIMRRTAEGDLTQRLETDGENEAMDRIAEEFNAMVGELEVTTGQLKQFAADVEETGVVLQSSSETVRVSSEHVADSVATISADAEEQTERLETVATELDDVVAMLEDFADEHEDVDLAEPLERFEEFAGMVSEVATLAQQTMAESELVAGAAEEQAAEINEVSQRAEELTQSARPLRAMLEEFDTDVDEDLVDPRALEDGGPPSGQAETDGEGQ